jgi:large subunit ribosomal protein L9
MKVILLQDIPNIGKKFEVKEVKAGYARNFLLPQKLAQVATESALKQLKERKELLEKKRQEKIEQLKEIAKKLEGVKLNFTLKEGVKNEIFGSVSKLEIIKNLKNNGFTNADEWEIKLEKPLKTKGEHRLELHLGEGIKTQIKIEITTTR